jgi:hypothetical protein
MSSLPSRTSIFRGLGTLLTLQESPWRWKVGLSAALGMGVPLALFTLAGYQREGLINGRLHCALLRFVAY